MRLHTLPTQQPPHQMLIDPPQSAHPDLLTKLMEHPSRRPHTTQPGKAPPRGLFRQLSHDEIKRTGGGQPCQQMHAPQLRRIQAMTTTTRVTTRTQFDDEVIGHIIRELIEQSDGTDRRHVFSHARTLPNASAQASPPVWLHLAAHQAVA